MSYKKVKKLIASALENQKAMPAPIGLRRGIVNEIAFRQEVKRVSSTSVNEIAEPAVKGYSLNEPVKQKLRGYKIVYGSPKPIGISTPSRLF